MLNKAHRLTSTSSVESRPVGLANLALWLLFAVVGLTALTLVFVHAPGRIKLIGLYAVVYGLIAGGALGLLARKLRLPSTMRLVVISFLLIAAGEMGIAIESHRVWAAGGWDAFDKSPTGKLAAEVLINPGSPADLRASLQESLDRQHEEFSFPGYLARRVSPLGAWPAPWPTVAWLAEVVLAAAAGCWAFQKQALALNAGGTCD
ncbi:MAG: hypothetical protein WD648_09375 [Planctomycetaceae bacterium]